MTMFEEFAKEMKVEITTGENGMYTGMASALAQIVNEVILSDDEAIRTAAWEEQKKSLKRTFTKYFLTWHNRKEGTK